MTSLFLALMVGSQGVSTEPGYIQDWRMTLLVDRIVASVDPETYGAALHGQTSIPWQSVPISVAEGLKDYFPKVTQSGHPSLNSEMFMQMNTRMYVRDSETKGFYEVDLNGLPKLARSRMPIPSFPPARLFKSEQALRLDAKKATTHIVEAMIKNHALPEYLTAADFLAGHQPLKDLDRPSVDWLCTLATEGKDLSVKKDLVAMLRDDGRRAKCSVEFVVQCVIDIHSEGSLSGRAFNLPK